MTEVSPNSFGFDPTGAAVAIDSNAAGNFVRVKTGAWINIFQRYGVMMGDVTKTN